MAGADSAYRVGTSSPVMMFELSITSWCNFRCAYCVTSVQSHRDAAEHAFDKHPVTAWVAAFARVPHDFSLVCRGGEPFLDHENFSPFLAGVGVLPQLKYVRVDTNGSWAPERYGAVPAATRARVQLNLSYHPTQVGWDAFRKRLHRIVDAGWQVGMVNYVLEAHQADDYPTVRDAIRDEFGIFVNPNPDIFNEAFASADVVVQQVARKRLAVLLPAIDVERKTMVPTAGRACFYPSIAYYIAPSGVAARACGARDLTEPPRLDFIQHSDRVRPIATPVRCPQQACPCLDRYAFMTEVPARGRSLDLLGEYVGACRAHQSAS